MLEYRRTGCIGGVTLNGSNGRPLRGMIYDFGFTTPTKRYGVNLRVEVNSVRDDVEVILTRFS